MSGRAFTGVVKRAAGLCAVIASIAATGCGGGSSSSAYSNQLNAPPSSANSGTSSGGSSSGGTSSSNGNSGASGSTSGSAGGGSNSTSTAAFLYVGMDEIYSTYYGTQLPRTGHASIAGFSISSDGSLQATAGSPYAGPAADLAANAASSVYAASGSTLNVNRINVDGSLTTTATLAAQPVGNSVGIYENLNFDAPAQMFYATANHGSGDHYFEIYKSSADGSLTNNGIQQTSVSPFPLHFTADGKRAYEPFCYHLSSNIFFQNVGGDGKFSTSDSKAVIPILDGQYPACPHALAVSPDAKFVATVLNSVTSSAAALGFWSINSDGTLTSVSGSPYARTAPSEDIAWDPFGKYVAVAAKDGLWIYSFASGSAPVPVGGAAVIASPIDHVVFNKAGTLLFAVNAAGQDVYIFNFNSSLGIATPAPGSPHNMSLAPYALVVAER